MAEDHATERQPGSPGQRALGAMESAVRRARASAGAAPLPSPPSPSPRDRPPAMPDDPPVRASEDRRYRWLVGSVATAAALVVAAAVALIVSLGIGSAPRSPTGARSAPTTTVPGRAPSTSAHGDGRSTRGPTTTSSSTVPSTVAVAPAGPPAISSLSPSSGTAGQTITVAGSNLLSTDGRIVATFNGQVAPTSCPAQNRCTVTVPPAADPSAQVVITTAGGTSNAITFTYG
jgi:IPT/TIG domain